MRPLQGRHRVACGRVLEQLVQRFHEVGEFFFQRSAKELKLRRFLITPLQLGQE
jgi:hypothetical protein